METLDLRSLSADMSLPLPPVKRRRTGSESSYEPDPNEAEDASSNVSSEGRVLVETLPVPIHRRMLQREESKVVKAYRARRSYRSTSVAPKPLQTYALRPSAPRPRARSRAREVKLTFKLRDQISTSKVSITPSTDVLNSEEPLIAPSTAFASRNLRRRTPVRYRVAGRPRRATEVRNPSSEVRTNNSIDLPKHHRGRGEINYQPECQIVPKPPSPIEVREQPRAQNRISELEKENATLEEENIALRAQVDELCSRIGQVGPSNNLGTAPVKDDIFFETGFMNLNRMIRDFVREFLQPRFTSPLSPSRVPAKIKEILNSEGTDWQRYLRGGKNRKVLRAIAHSQLRDAISTIQTALIGDRSACNRWRSRTIEDLRSTLPKLLPDDSMVELKSKELFRDTRVLWIKKQETKETERLRRITEYALKLATELHKLPYEIQYSFSGDNWDRLPRDIDNQPEKEFYQINVHSRHSNFQFLTVFPGIRKLSGISGTGELDDSEVVYLPLQLSAYD
ncbi:hypothetical protein TWF718_002669 [Orbilia javanica]|uniref:Uncharacterized protein n=1 Tax=Orbilia javanica TaxID=47235 RepID=A0AAN8MG86_9PEZI